jgi:hypothetical protein
MGRHRAPLGPELRELSERMRAVAAGHGGVITTALSGSVGADDAAIRRLVSSGEWCRARRGVYRDPRFAPHQRSPDATAHHARCAVLLAALGSGAAAVSHTSAARLLDLPLPPSTADDVVLTRRPPASANRIGAGSRVHVARFDDADVVDVAGVPVLGGARLVLDCCCVLRPESALAVADAALGRHLVTRHELSVELRRRRSRPGARLAALIVERADPLAESWFESISRWWLLEAGLPRPVLQERFADERGAVRARVDLWLPAHRTVGEADGAAKYSTPGALFAEKQREDWLRDAHRVEVVRWVPREMAGPAGRAAVAGRFHRAFARHSGRPPPPHSGNPGRSGPDSCRSAEGV